MPLAATAAGRVPLTGTIRPSRLSSPSAAQPSSVSGLTTFKPHEKDAEGHPYPTYRCLFPEAPNEENVFNCSEVGVLGAVAGVMGTLQAVEVLKEITGAGDTMAGTLTIYDALGGRFQSIRLKWNPKNPLSGEHPTITDLSSHAKSA